MRRLMACVVMVLAFAACEARAEIEVNDDGSGAMGFTFFIDSKSLALLGGFGGGTDPFEDFKKDLADAPANFDIQEFKEDGGRGIRAKAPFKDVADLKRLTGDFAKDSGDSPFGEGFNDFTLEQTGGGWTFRAKAQGPGKSTLGGSSGGFGPSFNPGQLDALIQVQFRVTLPGAAVTTTATRTERTGGRTTFIWQPKLSDKQDISMVAVTKPGGGGVLGVGDFPLIPVLIGAALLLALIASAVMKQRKTATAPPVGDGALPPEPGKGTVIPPPPPPD